MFLIITLVCSTLVIIHLIRTLDFYWGRKEGFIISIRHAVCCYASMAAETHAMCYEA